MSVWSVGSYQKQKQGNDRAHLVFFDKSPWQVCRLDYRWLETNVQIRNNRATPATAMGTDVMGICGVVGPGLGALIPVTLCVLRHM